MSLPRCPMGGARQAGTVPVLAVDDVHTHFFTRRGVVRAVDGVTVSVGVGETVGVVGESGSGKTVLGLSILGLVPRPGRIVSGGIWLGSRDLVALDARGLRSVRGAEVAMTFQDPMSSLDPVMRIRGQISEAMTAHGRGADHARRRVGTLLSRVGMPDPERRARDYPHQLSGGMRQRVMIAMGIANHPGLLIADEVTTALDVAAQARIIALLAELNGELGMAVMLITHDLALAAASCRRIVVMYAGRVVEEGPVHRVLDDPQHPYTWHLLRSVPSPTSSRGRLLTMPGSPPDLVAPPGGCRFHPRCPWREHRCLAEEPRLDAVAPGHVARCWVGMNRVLATENPAPAREHARGGRVEVRSPHPVMTGGAAARAGVDEPILRARDLVKEFSRGAGRSAIRAVDGVSLELRRGETLGLIGESGCGKSTLARLITHLIPATSGSVLFEGRDLHRLGGGELRASRRRLQMVFQDPHASLNPRMRVADIVREPLDNFRVGTREERRIRTQHLLDRVGIDQRLVERRPHELSGGQRQRVGIARALALNPSLIACDEPVSSLDVSIQAQIVNLLADLQEDLGLTFLFISHDLGVVRQLADRIAVMRLGRLVEVGAAEEICSAPRHPYTRVLLDAVPDPWRDRRTATRGDGHTSA